MFKHSIKQIWRGLFRYKSFTIINLLGLSIGISAIIILFLIANNEKSFDDLHKNQDQIYRVVSEQDKGGKPEYTANVPYPTAGDFRNEYPGAVATIVHYDRDRNIRIANKPPFSETNILFADSLFFQVFDFANIKDFWIKGNPAKALLEPNKAILTETTARKYFGDEDPIGKLFKLDNKADIEVVALVKDIPSTTHLPTNLFISFSTLYNNALTAGLDYKSWTFRGNGYCYIKMPSKNMAGGVTNALNRIVQNHAREASDKKEKWNLQQIADIHFNPTYESSNPGYTVSEKYLDLLLLLGGFIILIACINYINLSTSLAFSKSKEVGIRKTIGASKQQLFFYYLLETVILTTVACIMAIVLVYFLLPTVNSLLEKSLSLLSLVNIKVVFTAITALLCISIISGAYPAIILSGFKPIDTLKNTIALPGKSSGLLRKGLVVFQFSTSIALIICTIIIASQVQYFSNKSLGFNKDAVIEVALPESDSAKIQSFKAELQNKAGIRNFSFCIGAPVSDNNINTSMKAPELNPEVEHSIKMMPCDENYLSTYGLQIIGGRWFLPGEIKAKGVAMVINESTMRTLGYKRPEEVLGKKIQTGLNDYNPAVIGVVKDFHTNTLHEAIKPVGLLPFPPFYFATGIRIEPRNIKQSLATVESAYRKVYPDDVYDFRFIDQTLAERYKQERMDFNLFKAFSIISIFICCIGLWGLLAFVVVRKTKEIGIRKVLGASISSIVGLLSKDFVILVVIALAVASPIAWYFMNNWLQSFAYRINVSGWVFVIAGAFAIAIALITISFQAIKAALANPVKNLRTE